MKMYGIYKIESPNGKCYIGRASNLYRRLNKYKNGHNKGQDYINRAINKYGWDSMNVSILWQTNNPENINDILNTLEIDFINMYDCISPNGYNLKGGGGGKNISMETRKKLSKSMRAVSAKRNSRYYDNFINAGKRVRFVKGVSPSTESIERSAISRMKKILQFSMDGEFIMEWGSIKEASESVGVDRSCISRCCLGENKSSAGFKWEYKNI